MSFLTLSKSKSISSVALLGYDKDLDWLVSQTRYDLVFAKPSKAHFRMIWQTIFI